MSKIGYGYGSEWHMLRFLGRHRAYLNGLICGCTRAASVSWLDCEFALDSQACDREWKGIDFIADDRIQAKWNEFWPHTGNVQNWDALGTMDFRHSKEWLLLEAKSHIDETRTDCQAKESGGLGQIIVALDETKRFLGARAEADWLHGYYQYCNRLATLFFLCENNIPAHLIFLYFVNDAIEGKVAPKSEDLWRLEIQERNDALGIPKGHPLVSRIHHIVVDVCGRALEELGNSG